MKITTKNFRKYLSSFVRRDKSIKVLANELLAFGLDHAWEHGDTVYLNQFYHSLDAGRQAQALRYITACMSTTLGDLSTCWLSRKKGEWIINTEMTDRPVFFRQRVKDEGENKFKQVEVKLERPADLVEHPSFIEINPDQVKNPFTTESVLNSLNTLVKRTQKNEDKVDENLIDELAKFQKRMVKKYTPKDSEVSSASATN